MGDDCSTLPLRGLPAAKRLARGVSERGAGLRLVESMALAHADGVVEVACNLLGGVEGAPPSDVQVGGGKGY